MVLFLTDYKRVEKLNDWRNGNIIKYFRSWQNIRSKKQVAEKYIAIKAILCTWSLKRNLS